MIVTLINFCYAKYMYPRVKIFRAMLQCPFQEVRARQTDICSITLRLNMSEDKVSLPVTILTLCLLITFVNRLDPDRARLSGYKLFDILISLKKRYL